MSIVDELKRLRESEGPVAALDRLIAHHQDRGEHLLWFQAMLLKRRHEMDLPLARPMALDDLPEEKRPAFEEAYVEAARAVGQWLLDNDRLPEAWMYFRQIRETETVRKAFDAISANREMDDLTEQLIHVAIYEGAHPVKGLEIMLHTHGTCNTITAYDQQAQQLPGADQRQAAALLVDHLYGELLGVVQQEVQSRMAMTPPSASLRELIAGRDWLFADGNYHVDVSHLHSVVRFARTLEAEDPQLPKAVELAEYGAELDDQFRYPGDAPFDDYYPAHVAFFKAVLDQDRDASVGYFRDKLAAEPDEEDKALIAFVLVDLLTRCGRMDEAVDVAAAHLAGVEEATGFSLAQLCQDAGRMDKLKEVAEERGDLLGLTAAIL